MKQLRLFLLPVLLLFLQQSAFANLWGYIDDKGVAHLAAERVDARYELFFKSGESFDTEQNLKTSGLAKTSAGSSGAPLSAAEVKAQTAKNSKIQAYFDVSPNYKAVKHHMREAAKTHSIDLELLQALIVAESGFDTQAVSPKGAVGLMQLMPPTAERFGVKADKVKTIEQKLTDPKTNISAGTKYLRLLMNMFPGKLELAIASYNAGEGAVKRAGNQIPNYKETQNYVKTVLQTYYALKPSAAVATVLTSAAGAVPGAKGDTMSARRNLPPTRVKMELIGAPTGAPTPKPAEIVAATVVTTATSHAPAAASAPNSALVPIIYE